MSHTMFDEKGDLLLPEYIEGYVSLTHGSRPYKSCELYLRRVPTLDSMRGLISTAQLLKDELTLSGKFIGIYISDSEDTEFTITVKWGLTPEELEGCILSDAQDALTRAHADVLSSERQVKIKQKVVDDLLKV